MDDNADREKDLHSGNEKEQTAILFINRTSKKLKLYWLDSEGKRQPYGTLEPEGRGGTVEHD